MITRVNIIKSFVFFICVNFSISVAAQDYDLSGVLKIKTIPYVMKIFNDPLRIQILGDSVIKVSSKGKTNLFNNPNGRSSVQNAPMLLFHPDSNFVIRTKVTADLKEVYDVAALVIYQNNDLWAKLCFENSVNKEATVVSVVTRKYSDDCNSVRIDNNFVYLSIAKKGKEFSFHYSKDNTKWELIRHFRLESNDDDLMVGFAAHCSVGQSFSADFSNINYLNGKLENMRKYK